MSTIKNNRCVILPTSAPSHRSVSQDEVVSTTGKEGSELWEAPTPSTGALVGGQGRGCAEGVPPDLCHVLLLKILLFPEPEKCVALLGHRGSRSPRHLRRASQP